MGDNGIRGKDVDVDISELLNDVERLLQKPWVTILLTIIIKLKLYIKYY